MEELRLAELKEAFAMFDKDGDGAVSLKELATTLALLGILPTEDELQLMFNSVDVDRNGVIDFAEFEKLMQPGGPLMAATAGREGEDDEENIRAAFKAFDKNGDGFISEEELRQAMLSLGENLAPAEVQAMMQAADKDGNGKIDFEEFKEMIHHQQN